MYYLLSMTNASLLTEHLAATLIYAD